MLHVDLAAPRSLQIDDQRTPQVPGDPGLVACGAISPVRAGSGVQVPDPSRLALAARLR
jgi:hypothetical protein